jgi:hypothetical protein
MIRHRSRLPLILILALFAGLGGFHWYGHLPHEAIGDSVAEDSGKVPDGFGPIPTVAAPDDRPRPAIPPGHAGADVSSEAMRKLAPRMSRDTSGLKVITHADGRQSVNLGGRFMHMSAVVTGADGKTQVRCFSGHQEMVAATTASPAPTVPQPFPHVR